MLATKKFIVSLIIFEAMQITLKIHDISLGTMSSIFTKIDTTKIQTALIIFICFFFSL